MTIIGCSSTYWGGGSSIRLSSIVKILDSLIANNSAASHGGECCRKILSNVRLKRLKRSS